MKFIIKCFEANYPESLGMLLIHNAPWIFSGKFPRSILSRLKHADSEIGIWKLIQGWMDPVVASKVHFTKSVNDLDKFISRNQIPKELKGDENWEYKYIEPEKDENAVMQDTSTRDSLMFDRLMISLKMVAATATWISATTFAEGKVDNEKVEELKSRRNAIVGDFQSNYWKLDPYIRERAIIDRTGVLQPGANVARNGKTNGETNGETNGKAK